MVIAALTADLSVSLTPTDDDLFGAPFHAPSHHSRETARAGEVGTDCGYVVEIADRVVVGTATWRTCLSVVDLLRTALTSASPSWHVFLPYALPFDVVSPLSPRRAGCPVLTSLWMLMERYFLRQERLQSFSELGQTLMQQRVRRPQPL